MKTSLSIFSALFVATGTLAAQETVFPGRINLYGEVRTFASFDTRESKEGNEPLAYCAPYDQTLNLQGKDIYSNPSFKLQALSTIVGIDLDAFKVGTLDLTGKIEGDFVLRSGNSSQFRLRQAYVDLVREDRFAEINRATLRVGQAWHPMSVDHPYCAMEETGVPFNPYSRSPQVMLDLHFYEGFDVSVGALYPVDCSPVGPKGESEDYVGYSLVPELYGGIYFSKKGFTAKIGSDFLLMRPRWQTLSTDGVTYDAGTKVNDKFFTFSPFAYLEWKKGRFAVNAKSVFANGGEHLNLLSGYALYDYSDIYNYKYTPLRSTVSYFSIRYGNKWRLSAMGGYMKALGAARDLTLLSTGFADPDDIFFSSNGSYNINQFVRAAPCVSFNKDNLSLAAEYSLNLVQYGDETFLNRRALPYAETLHWIMSHRVLAVLKYRF